MSGAAAHLLRGIALTILVASPAMAQSDLPTIRSGPVLAWPKIPGPVIVDTSDPAVPEAEEVLGDIPNVFAWSRFQSGTLGDWSYRMFPDGSAIVLPDVDRSEADFLVTCTLAVSCDISGSDGSRTTVPAIGAPRPDPPPAPGGAGVSRYLAEWILAGTGTPPPVPPPPPPPQIEETVEIPEELAAEPTTPVAEGVVEPETPAFSESCAAPDPFFPDVCDVPSGPSPGTAKRRTGPTPSGGADDGGAGGAATQTGTEPRLSLAERFRLSCSLSSGLGLRYFDLASLDDDYGKLRASIGCSARITERLSARVSLVVYPISGQQQPWDPDFTYAFNYKLTDRITIGYSSYTARFSGPGTTFRESLTGGSLRASLKLPDMPLPLDRTAACTVGIGLPDPFDASATLSCGFSVNEKLRLSGTSYIYAPGRQLSFNPDYSYTASYKISDRVQFTYANYGNNRWPWNPADGDPPGILGGSLSLSYKLQF